MDFFGKLLPVDGYYVVLNGNLTNNYTQSLTHLYQPLIGFEAIALYQTLLHEIDLQKNDTIQTHHTLMNYLNVSLDQIYDMRLKLEGIGLLNTYEYETDEKTIYTYELFSPFSPSEFFQDAMLTELLYHHIGEAKFKLLKNHYQKDKSLIKGTNITSTFHDVFQTFKPSYLPNEPIESHVNETEVPVHLIDFSHIKETLKQQMIPVEYVLTKRNKEIISQMTHLYGLDSYEVEKSLLWALTEENRLDIDEFKQACHDLFQAKYNEVSIQLSQKNVKNNITTEKPESKEERLIQTLETISPRQLLEDLSRGKNASEQDMKLIRDVMLKQGLPTPVMNVLIHFVLLQTNMQLSRGYLEKVASHWSRANLKTVREAMEFAKEQLNQYKRKSNDRKHKTKEVIPDWFNDRQQKEKSQVKSKKRDDSLKQAEEKEEVLAMLQKHVSKKG